MPYTKLNSSLLAAVEGGASQSTGFAMESAPDPTVPVFIQTTHATQQLSSVGVNEQSRAGNIVTARVPISALQVLDADAQVVAIEGAQRLRPLMDRARQAIQRPIVPTPADWGQGVVIGIVDTGIDGGHPAFAGRIHSVWDQLNPAGPGPWSGAIGTVLRGTATSSAVDTNGHGTHVSGTAAGAGLSVSGSNDLWGIAPAATIVVVRTTFSNLDIADGVRFVFDEAANLNLPAVVNLSLGGHSDAHDGTDALSRFIDAISGPGRIVCAAAGNEREEPIHALLPPGTQTARVRVPSGDIERVWLNCWTGAGVGARFRVRSPGGFTTPWTSTNLRATLPDGRVATYVTEPDPMNGDMDVLILLLPALLSGRVASGNWVLEVDSPEPVHVWLDDDSEKYDASFLDHVDPTILIGSPGAAASAVTVAASVTRNTWTDINGSGWSISQTIGDIAPFSSPGPLRTATSDKPDITAPGAQIASALSAQTASTTPDHWKLSPQVRLMQGTSMATPIVTGIVARMLQLNSSLNPAQVRQHLQSISTIPGQPPGHRNDDWGHGLPDCSQL